MDAFGQRLKEERERLQLTQDAPGKLLGVSQQTVAQWEAGNAYPRRKRRQHLLQILGPKSSLAPRPTTVVRTETLLPTPAAPPGELARHLPPELHSYLNRDYRMGGNQTRYDYLSPHVIAMVKHLGSDRHMVWYRLAPEILRLAVARQLDEATGRRREHLLVAVHSEPVHYRLAQRVAFEAGTLGVGLVQVHTFAEAAEAIRRAEHEGPGLPDQDTSPEDLDDLMADFDRE